MTLPLATTKLASTKEEAAIKLGPWRVVSLPRLSDATGAYFAEQVHGGNIVPAMELAAGTVAADGVLLESAGEKAGVYTADCVPVVITAQTKAVILHVSRKSIVRGLMDNATTHIAPADIDHVYLGPHICEFHFGFEDEGELIRRFRYRFPEAVHFHKGILYLSLRKAVRSVLADWNVHETKIQEDGRCTFEHPELASYKRDGKQDRMRTIVWRPTEVT